MISFAVGFAAVLWREGRPPGIGLRHLAEVTSLLQREDYDHALDRLRVATTLAPDDDNALFFLGVALQQTGDLAGAKRAYQRVLTIRPWHADAHFRLGLLHLQEHNIEAAVWHNRIAVQLQPGSAPARTNLAVSLLRQGKAAEAEEHLREALRIQPGFDPARKTLEQLLGTTASAP